MAYVLDSVCLYVYRWVVVKIMVPLWVPLIIRHLLLGYPKRDPNFDNYPDRGTSYMHEGQRGRKRGHRSPDHPLTLHLRALRSKSLNPESLEALNPKHVLT